MRLKKLIQQFDVKEVLPVDVNEVVQFLRDEQIKDEIRFVGVDIDSTVLRGFIKHYVIPGVGYGEPTFCADVYYDQSQSGDWKRLVCCKELLHILDNDHCRTNTEDAIEHQIERMILPEEFQNFHSESLGVQTDRLTIYYAVAVLFPWAARNLLVEPYEKGRLTVADIARIADIPERYAMLVMNTEWRRVHDIMTKSVSPKSVRKMSHRRVSPATPTPKKE